MKPDAVLVPVTESDHLASLADTANREHELTFGSALEALKHAILCGEALIEARQNVPDGEWNRWARINLRIEPGPLSVYVRLATHKEKLAVPGGPSSISGAVGYLKQIGAPTAPHSRNGKRPLFDVAEARRLREQGATYEAIGEMLGVPGENVRRQLVPNAREKDKRNAAQWRKRRRQEKLALIAQERDAAVKKAGGSPAEAYALLRRCALKIDQAMLDAPDNEQREQLRVALKWTHRAEEAIVRALRIGRQS